VLLLELAAQGVKGVAPAGGRATLRPGYNVVAADGAALRRLLAALLLPGARDGEGLPRAPGGPQGAAMKGGLTLVGDDRVTYRVVRDFAAGCALQRFDATKRSFSPVAQDLAAVAAFLRETAGAPAPGRLSALLTLSAADLPSKVAGGMGGGPPLPAQRPPASPEQARKRIAELKGELERARASEKLQARQDALQQRLYQLDETSQAGKRLREGLAKAEDDRAELEPLARVAESLGDPGARVAAYEKLSGKREEALARAATERDAIAEAEARGPPPRLWNMPEFLGGVAAGAAALGVGIAGVVTGSGLRWVALLDVPGFGWAAWTAWRWVGTLETSERVARRKRLVDDWERKTLETFDRDAADVRAALKAANVSRVEDLKEALGRLADADSVVAEWRRRLSAWEASPEARAAREERSRVEQELRDAEAELSEQSGGFVRDVRSVEQELRRAEQDAAAPRPAAAAPPQAPPARPAGDPLRLALDAAGAELSSSAAGAGRAIQAKASQVLSGLSFQRLSSLSVDDRGNVQVTAGGRPGPAAALAPADRDLVWLALKLALLEQGLAGGGKVALVEDAFGGLSDGARRFAARWLKQIAKGGQVVHGTADAAFREAADHAVA
jgi:hypothetical protein